MAKQTTENEKVPSTEITTRHITSAADTKFIADDLARFIREQKLFHNIQGKEYVNVEGWQYAGCRLGILPVVADLSRITTDLEEKEIKYQAKVQLFDIRTGQIVGTGFAICSNKESGKKFYQEFAIASMAQTRGIGKAYRNILAWIIRAAGYEPTPAEEMDYIITTVVADKPVKPVATEPLNSKKNSPEIAAAVENYVDVPPKDVKESIPVTINQKTQILLLLNHTTITVDEKQKMVAKLNTFDTVRGDQAIAKLKKTIHERSTAIVEETGEVAKGALIAEIDDLIGNPVFQEEEREQIREHIASGVWLASEAKACIQMVKERIARTKTAA